MNKKLSITDRNAAIKKLKGWQLVKDRNAITKTFKFKDFNAAIQEALNFAKYYGNTLVVVTADHETGGLALLGGKKNRVFGKFNTEGHSATMVPVFSFGPNAESFKGIYENTEIFEKLKNTLK